MAEPNKSDTAPLGQRPKVGATIVLLVVLQILILMICQKLESSAPNLTVEIWALTYHAMLGAGVAMLTTLALATRTRLWSFLVVLGVIPGISVSAAIFGDASADTASRPYSATFVIPAWLGGIVALGTRIRGWRLGVTTHLKDPPRYWQMSLANVVWLTVFFALGMTPLTMDAEELREVMVLWAYIFCPTLAVVHANVLARLLLAHRCKMLVVMGYLASFLYLLLMCHFYALADAPAGDRNLPLRIDPESAAVIEITVAALASFVWMIFVMEILRTSGLRFERRTKSKHSVAGDSTAGFGQKLDSASPAA